MRTKYPVKTGDVLVYIFILLLIGGSFFGIHLMGAGSEQLRVAIRVDEELIGTYDMPSGKETKEIRVDAGEGHYNLVVITSSGAYIKEANCPDQICVNWGQITKPGQTVICLPHRVVVSIIGDEEGEPPLDGISS